MALIPGLVFDQKKHRIGYGKGFYDRLINSFPSTTQTMGIGFLEQSANENLPIFSTDIELTTTLLF